MLIILRIERPMLLSGRLVSNLLEVSSIQTLTFSVVIV